MLRALAIKSADGAAETILDCSRTWRHFHVDGATVTIDGVTLRNGRVEEQQIFALPDPHGG
eukprot:3111342-Rhodomonas_salina.1